MSNIDDDRKAFPRQYTDEEMSGMALREYAAIHLRVPNSGIDWLDDMIREAKRDELAGQALAGQLAFSPHDNFEKYHQPEEVASVCYQFADAMLAERNKGSS